MNSHWSDITWTETVGMKRFVLRNQHGDKVEKAESFRFMTLVIFSSFICRGLDMHSPANLTQVSGLMFEVHSSSTENGLQPGLWYSCSGFSVILEPQNKFHLPLLYWSVGKKTVTEKCTFKVKKMKRKPYIICICLISDQHVFWCFCEPNSEESLNNWSSGRSWNCCWSRFVHWSHLGFLHHGSKTGITDPSESFLDITITGHLLLLMLPPRTCEEWILRNE